MGAYGLPRAGIKRVFCVIVWEEDGSEYLSLEEVSEAERQPLPTKVGSMVMFSSMIPHGSLVNHTDTIRWSMDLRYQALGKPTGRWYVPGFRRPESFKSLTWRHPTARRGSLKLSVSKRRQTNTPNGHVIVGPRRNKLAQRNFSMVRIPITMCHGIRHDGDYPLTSDHLDRLVKIAAELNFESIDYNQLFRWFREGGKLPARPIMFDFDHPVKSMRYEIHDVLSKYGYAGNLFINTGPVDELYAQVLCHRIPSVKS